MRKLPAGVSKYKSLLPRSVAQVIITATDVSFTENEILNIDRWEELIRDEQKVYIPAGLYEYAILTDDTSINTTSTSKKTRLRDGYASIRVHLESNFCDYNRIIQELTSTIYRVIFVLEDGKIYATQDRNGRIKGFKTEIKPVKNPLPGESEIQVSYPLLMNFKDKQEMNNIYMCKPEWWYDNLLDLMKIGLTIMMKSDYSVFENYGYFKAVRPCRTELTSLETTDFVIIDYSIASNQSLVIDSIVYDNELKRFKLRVKDGLGNPLVECDFFTVKIDNEIYSSSEFSFKVIGNSLGGDYSENDFNEDWNIGTI
jgi:hypothetical protein